MEWIKQNLRLVISIGVAVVVAGGGTYWVYSQIQKDKLVEAELETVQNDWERLERKSPHPGTDQINNIRKAQEDLEDVQDVHTTVRESFSSLNYPVVTDGFQFKTMLERSVSQMRKEAEVSGVRLPSGEYAFSFGGLLNRVQFAPENIQQWSDQLEEIRSLGGILFSQRVHSIEKMRRTVINDQYDTGGRDFIGNSIITNSVAVLVPYEVVFKGYSGELAGVLEAFANAREGYRVRAISVKPTTIAVIAPVVTLSSAQGINQLRGPVAANSTTGLTAAQKRAARYGPQGGAATVRTPIQQRLVRQPIIQAARPRISDSVKESPLEITLFIDLIKPILPDSDSQ